MTFFTYRASQMPWHWYGVGIGLKILGLTILLICLLEPLATMERPRPQANVFGVVVDNSQSMRTALEGISDNALADWQKHLSDDAEWMRTLGNDFRVRRYLFDHAIKPVDTLERLALDGGQSRLGATMESLKQRFEGRPLAGVMLFSDGQWTDQGMQSKDWKALGFPVYPVRMGNMRSLPDIKLSRVSTRQSDFEASPVSMTAMLTHSGLGGEKVVVELIDAQSSVVETKEVVLEDADETVVEFRFRPKESGVQGYRIETYLASELTKLDSATPGKGKQEPRELTLGNNRRFQVVDRGRGPYRILYVAGRPNWEHKFLKRALDLDDEIQLSSLVRIAKKEPKFSFRDSKIDNSNPLFSGFEDISEEEKEQYSQPVFTRMGVQSADQLKGGFPKSAEELFQYHAIILDDLEHDFFTQDQQSLLRQFVSIRGGGLLALGGQESMRGTGFRNSVLSQLLPVYGEDVLNADAQPILARYQLTREGWLQPFLRTADTEGTQKQLMEDMPPFEVVNRTRDIKPGASVLAEVALDEEHVLPALIVQKFGKGKTGAFMIGDFWRWGMHHDGPGEAPMFQAWRQMIRWMITDVPRKVAMRTDTTEPGQRVVKLLVETHDAEFKPLDNANVQIEVTTPTQTKLQIQAEPSADRPGVYETTLVQESEGVYTAVAKVTAPDGSEEGSAHVGWVHEPSILEFQSLGENASVLQSIAESTGGEVVELDGLDSLVQSLPSRHVPLTEIKVFPLWHQTWVLLLAIGCLCGEWGLRRWHGMA